ncbi:hypothetical protein [Actinosynnema sp. NPDC023587]|uniref:hypothetical protein n=1 Tax=Actinosynnema sp. NPDC023587 TaxID=3154695 RepID=UPI00340014C2
MASQDDNLIHIEVKRSWWNGRSTTLCGRTIQDAETIWAWCSSRTMCPACQKISAKR